MEFIPGSHTVHDCVFVGVGEFITTYIDDENSVIHSVEEIDEYLDVYYKYLIVDGESKNDLALLDSIIDRCETGEVSLIIINQLHPEIVSQMRSKLSYILCIDAEGAVQKLERLKDVLVHLHADDTMLDLDEAELRHIFNGDKAIDLYSLKYDDELSIDTVSKDINALSLVKNSGSTLVCIFISPGDGTDDKIIDIYKIMEQLILLIPCSRHTPLLWNVYQNDTLRAGEMQIEIIRTKPHFSVMDILRAQNETIV